jgi:hypothetical protein
MEVHHHHYTVPGAFSFFTYDMAYCTTAVPNKIDAGMFMYTRRQSTTTVLPNPPGYHFLCTRIGEVGTNPPSTKMVWAILLANG